MKNKIYILLAIALTGIQGCTKITSEEISCKVPVNRPLLSDSIFYTSGTSNNYVYVENYQSGVTYEWTDPDGYTYTGSSFTIQYYADAGYYSVVASRGGCKSEPAKFTVDIDQPGCGLAANKLVTDVASGTITFSKGTYYNTPGNYRIVLSSGSATSLTIKLGKALQNGTNTFNFEDYYYSPSTSECTMRLSLGSFNNYDSDDVGTMKITYVPGGTSVIEFCNGRFSGGYTVRGNLTFSL